MSKSASNYRPDIDGLRALAVLSVLLFHAKFEFLSGGYIGVDVFFVISGYLITSIIAKEIAQGKFSILGFYERRFRRLLPALFVVVVLTSLAGMVLLHPRDLVDLAQSVLATSLFSSNILFYFEAGYFDAPAEFKPLLHTWSLAVEEQYYVLFPLILVIISKYFADGIRQWVLLLFALSFILCVVGTRLDPSAAFYLLPSRAWELLAGSLIAVNTFPALTSRLLREALAVCGIAFILLSLFLFTPDSVFPGYIALLPVVGTMLLLYSGESRDGKTIAAKILSYQPLVFIGLISYSLYLWHWPVLVFGNYATASDLNALQLGFALALIFLLATLSWLYVETPFRRKQLFAARNPLLAASGVASLLMVIFGIVLITADGWPGRYNYANDDHVNDAIEWDRWGKCQNNMKTRLAAVDGLCDIGTGDGSPEFLFWGDSHARALAPAVEKSAIEHNVNGAIATKTACPPLLGIDRVGHKSCAEFNDSIVETLKANRSIEIVILAARWNLVFTGERYKEESGSAVDFIDVHNDAVSELTNADYLELGLERTINRISELGKSVVIVNQIPEIGYDVPRIDFLSRILSSNLDNNISPSYSEFVERSVGADEIVKRLSEELNADVLEPSEYLCTDKICSVSTDGITLYLDDDHLSVAGSRFISSLFDTSLGRLK